MEKKCFIAPSKVNALISDTLTGSSIVFEDRTYLEVSRTPKGRRILKRLVNMDSTEKLVIYS